jgi:hypothetical protein
LKRLLLSIAVIALGAAWHPAPSSAGDDDEGRLKLGGSMRGRFEFFRFSEDETGTKRDTRGRIRYRFRLDGKVTINPRANFQFRLVSGNDSRSGNQTIGDPVDFGPNNIAIRSAMMVLTPWEDGKLPNGKGYWKFDFGRVKNPYVWKGSGKDMMLWDNDIALGGFGTQFGHQLGSQASFWINTGYYQIDENGSGPVDPYMAPVQVGITFGGDNVKAGIRGSYWYMTELDSLFVQRGVDGEGGVTSSGGNIQDGLTGSVYGGTLRVVSTQAFVSGKVGSVPLVLYGGYSTNLTAEPSQIYPGIGKSANAYNAGIEGGSKKKVMKLGLAFFYIEANAYPSQYIDSDFLDGRTNRYGPFLYLSKEVMKKTDFNTQIFWSDAIETDNEGYGVSASASERTRVQIDLLYHF